MSRQLSQLLAGLEATGSGDVRPVADAGTNGRRVARLNLSHG
jgi:hypothetical protein